MMETFSLVKLGTKCCDGATGLPGMVTHWIMDMGRHVQYLFQPEGLDEHQQPVPKLCLCLERLKVKKSDFEDVEVPFNILGTQVTDKASGFRGMATHFVRHPNGCFHVEIQPAGKVPKKGKPIQPCDFDIRQCKGRNIPVLSEVARQESMAREPSPEPTSQRRVFGSASMVPSRSMTSATISRSAR